MALPNRGAFEPAAALLLMALAAAMAGAQEADDEDEQPYRPGLIARYSGAGGTEATRLDRTVAFNWRSLTPDRRLPAGKFTARCVATREPGILPA